jgi:hypothetical protein
MRIDQVEIYLDKTNGAIEQRADGYLDPALADWCVATAKWPYHKWKAWLRQNQSGLSPPLLDAGH